MLDSGVPGRKATKKAGKAPKVPIPEMVPLAQLFVKLRETNPNPELHTKAVVAKRVHKIRGLPEKKKARQTLVNEVEDGCQENGILTLRAFAHALDAPLWKVIHDWELGDESMGMDELHVVVAYRQADTKLKEYVRRLLGLEPVPTAAKVPEKRGA
jgi:hypothetical protein